MRRLISRCRWDQWTFHEENTKIESKEGSVSDCMKELIKSLPQFINHVFVKRERSNMRNQAKVNKTVIQVDFSENYICR